MDAPLYPRGTCFLSICTAATRRRGGEICSRDSLEKLFTEVENELETIEMTSDEWKMANREKDGKMEGRKKR